MYFPYVRGHQYELLALRELVANNLLGKNIVPIVEPVKLSPTLVNTMAEFIKANHPISIIRNPAVGTFLSDYQKVKQDSKEATYRDKFEEQYKDSNVIKSVIIQNGCHELLNYWGEYDIVKKQDILVIATNRDWLWLYEKYFESEYPKFALIPDESVFRRKIRRNKVLLDDKFKKQRRNADYQDVTDEFFSDDHIYYIDDGFVGFSDYSIIGDEYSDSGFAPYAVAIHIVYFADDKTLRVKHFVSDSNDDISNPALKFYQAVEKLAKWYRNEKPNIEMTFGLKAFLDHYDNQTYPGLGTVKKLALMHHLELMSKHLGEGK